MAKFIKAAIKHPGRMHRLAERKGVSVHEAEVEASHSSNPSLRSAGNLGLRFGKGGDLHKHAVPRRKKRG
jgi:hypothetical protein